MDLPPDLDPTGALPEGERRALSCDGAGDDLEAWLADQRWRAALDGWMVDAARDGRAHPPGAGAAGTEA